MDRVSELDEPREREYATYEEAAVAACAADEAFRAALPGRMAAVVDLINGQLAGALPDGLRFEWAPDGE